MNKDSNSISNEQTKIISEQMDKCIFRINSYMSDKAVGFFCLIPNPKDFNKTPLRVLITQCLKLRENDYYTIYYTLNNKGYSNDIKIKKNRFIYSSSEQNFTIIEIIDKDRISNNSFLEIDNQIFNDNSKNIFENMPIYYLYYPLGKEITKSEGIINSICEDKVYFKHNCETNNYSYGPIINSNNNKVIGIHNYTKSLFLKDLIEKFNEKYNEYIINKTFIPKEKYLNKNFEILPLDYKNNYDYTYKIIYLGDKSSRKTSLIKGIFRFNYQIYFDDFPTSYMQYFTLTIKYKDKIIRLNIGDIASNERFRQLSKPHFKNSDLVIFVYNINNKESFNSVEKLIKDIKCECKPDAKFILIGNKKYDIEER